MKKIIQFTILITLLLVSCTMEKRKYRTGYFIDWNSRPKKIAPHPIPANPEPVFTLDPGHLNNLTYSREFEPGEGSENSAVNCDKTVLVRGKTGISKSNSIKQIPLLNDNSTIIPTSIINSKNTPVQSNDKSDGLMYLMAAFMTLSTLGLIKSGRKNTIKLTRWAKANPKKAQYAIAGIKLPLLGIGVMSGYNLHELGYEFSTNTIGLFSTLMSIGFLTVPFKSQNKIVLLPAQLNRHRMSYLAISLSSLMLMTSFGNRIEDRFPDSPVTHVIQNIDHSIFSSNQTNHIDPTKPLDDPKDSTNNNRKAVAGMSAGAAFILIFLLAILTCAGACLVVGGIVALIDGEALGLVAIMLGSFLLWLSIKGIKSVSHQRRETIESNKKR